MLLNRLILLLFEYCVFCFYNYNITTYLNLIDCWSDFGINGFVI